MARLVDFLADLPAQVEAPGLSLLAALAYPRERDLSAGDRAAWAAEIRAGCERVGIRLLGLRMATVDQVGPLETAA